MPCWSNYFLLLSPYPLFSLIQFISIWHLLQSVFVFLFYFTYHLSSSLKCNFHAYLVHCSAQQSVWHVSVLSKCLLRDKVNESTDKWNSVFLSQTLCNPLDCSLAGFSVYGTLQARILEWVAISCSRASSQLRDQTYVSCVSCIGRWIPYLRTTWEAQMA